MAIVTRKTKKGPVHWIVFKWQRRDVWERAGRDRREAERLEVQRRREVKAGTYMPAKERIATKFGPYVLAWAKKRRTRNADDDLAQIERYVMTRAWLAELPLADVKPAHMIQLIQELKESVSEKTGDPLSSKYVANIYGNVRTSLRDAMIAELIQRDPCGALPRGIIKRRKGAKKRAPYSMDDVLALTTGEKLSPERRVWNAMAFYLGAREGEVCGRRWRNWDREARPLTAMTIDTQYDDQPLKTERETGERPRVVPVHEDLARVLEWWWRQGYEMAFLRKPTQDDFIVPRRERGTGRILPHTKSSAYKAWIRSYGDASVTNLTLHSTRHTFITNARRNGARPDVLEMVTHNAAGKQIDAYTHWEWEPLCEAVSHFMRKPRLDSPLDRQVKSPRKVVEAPGIETGTPSGTIGSGRRRARHSAGGGAHDSRAENATPADLDAAQAIGRVATGIGRLVADPLFDVTGDA